MYEQIVCSNMSLNTRLQETWNSYWFRLLITGFPVGIIGGLMTLITNLFGLGTVEYFILLFTVLMSYGVLVEERYLKSWRRETVNSID